MEQRYKVLLKFFLNQGEKFCLVPNKKTCFCVMPSFLPAYRVRAVSVVLACFDTRKMLWVELVNAMGRNSKHYRMKQVTLTVAFGGGSG